jgi:hypothetical protein
MRKREEKRKMACGLHKGENGPFTYPLNWESLVYLLWCAAHKTELLQCVTSKFYFEGVLSTKSYFGSVL